MADKLLKGVTISRLMGPNEANVYGTVHGGHILNMIDEAGLILSSRYCNNAPNKDKTADDAATTLVRIEHMDFIAPMHIGEVAELTAKIVFTSPHSVEVVVTVSAENVIKGVRRLTNIARAWYCPMSIPHPDRILAVPQMSYESREMEESGRQAYEAQRQARANTPAHELRKPSHLFPHKDKEPQRFTVPYSNTVLSALIGPNDVTTHGCCRMGVLLKLMDECGAIVARKHCQNITVTACIEATNFHKSIPKGSLVNIFGWAHYTSDRSVETEVVVEFETPFQEGVSERAVDAIFTFVPLDDNGKPLPVPPLKVVHEEEKTRFEEGRQRYNQRKARVKEEQKK